jgi:hypothetical protein
MGWSMSLIDYIPFLGNSTETTDGLAELQAILADKQTTLDLSATFGRPTIDKQGTTTAVFPYTVTHEGAPYTNGAKEFVIPDEGLNGESSLSAFLTNYAIGTVADIGSIEGAEAESVTLTDSGDIRVI